ncbi:putative iron-sulfur cluster-binding metallochaperone [Deinococcus yunweiensis]|uniref:putative iron-sulfur cluster-binding metallochaperone n=1 Tax=Deinococcus yunweiensis TaxID=367282 RepID=UPI00398E9EC9
MEPQNHVSDGADHAFCPVTGVKGKAVKMVTLKALLTPHALAELNPKAEFRFCPDPMCDVVYFSENQTYRTDDIKVPVLQKSQSLDVPVCYCFGHTHSEVVKAAEADSGQKLEGSISAHIKAGRCGCEVNNPQGSCCLGNVKAIVRALIT